MQINTTSNIIFYIIGLGIIGLIVIILSNFFSPQLIPKILKAFSIYRSFSAIPTVCLVVLVTNLSIFYLLSLLITNDIKQEILFYLALTLTSIILTSFGDKLIKIWHKLNDREINIGISLKMLNQKRIRYLIFFAYFLLLVISTISSFNESGLSSNTVGFNKVIFQSFATYIAFDRLQSNWESIKIAK